MSYDSKNDTLKHIKLVEKLLFFIQSMLNSRAINHDKSKLEAPEKEFFDKYTPKLKNTTYGSDEYKQYLKEMKPALDWHYVKNRHHPEYFKNGISDMNIVDILEMFCDWLAATKRHDDGDIFRSIKINKERFNYSDELEQIFYNSVRIFEFFDLIEEKLIDIKDFEVREVVYDWFFGCDIENKEYKNNFDINNYNIAKNIIMELISNGLG
jgi:hypothetical protein